MAKSLTAAKADRQDQASGRRRTRASGTFLLVLKNVLFWGSIALSCYGIYRLGVYLLG